MELESTVILKPQSLGKEKKKGVGYIIFRMTNSSKEGTSDEGLSSVLSGDFHQSFSISDQESFFIS